MPVLEQPLSAETTTAAPKAPAGLTAAQASERFEQFGPNTIVAARRLSAVEAFLLRFKNPLVLILLGAAIISGFLGDVVSAGLIIAIVLASVVLDFFNTYKSQKAADDLKKRVMITATALRDGKETELPLSQIVPGDVVLLHPGDVIPADGEIAEEKDLYANESSLTGESFPVEKPVGSEAFMGSSIVVGKGVLVVKQTGARTKYSHIATALLKREEATEFDRGIKEFSVLIMKITFALVLFIFFVNALMRHDLLQSLLFAAALAVGLTPELLPMIIALNLSKGSLIMSRHGVIVKKLSAIQNFGGMDILCTDKTGTLTEDKIALVKYVDGKGNTSEPVLLRAYLNSCFSTGFRNPLDTAVKEFKQLGIDEYKKIDEIPFDYLRKRNSIVVEHGGKRQLIAKGAPEELFAITTQWGEGGEIGKESAMAEYERLSSDGFRVLAVAVRDIEEKPAYSREDELSLTFLGFVAFLDPAKQTASDTLKRLEAYGIEIKILTGDNELVTQKIARDIELPVKGIVLGHEIEHVTDDELRAKAESATIFARVTPDQKERIIQVLKKAEHVVGYLGDGINDAPPLKAADVGISVDNAVDVAKDTADIILLKKSLHDLIDGVIEGRRTFANTLKYLMMALSSNFGNMFSMAGASLLIPFLPMLPVQILFNNLLYDSSQFAIPTDRVDTDYVAQPRRFDVNFMRKFMIVFGPLSSAFDFLTFFVLLVLFHLEGAGFQTGWFLESIATQTFVVYVIRTKKLPFITSAPSKTLLWSTVAAVVAGWLIALTPVGSLMRFSPLSLGPLLAIAVITAAYLIIIEVAKRWFYRRLA